ncbi:MAG: hypothetical protein GY847_37110 [Proteobacteria bacterium]|nr:hypothetical protein [Pseudomonadota bacterium]
MNPYSINVSIPKDWTGEQALAVIDIIDEISTAIWNLHDEKILKAINDQKIQTKAISR